MAQLKEDGSAVLLTDEDVCPICLDSCRAVGAWGCGFFIMCPACERAFHPRCIYQWLRARKKCPNCRAAVAVPEGSCQQWLRRLQSPAKSTSSFSVTLGSEDSIEDSSESE